MGNPERKDNPEGSQSDEQRWDAEVVNGDHRPLDQVFNEIDSHQKKIELEWEAARAAYQQKIDQLMDDFLHEKLSKAESVESKSEVKPIKDDPPKNVPPTPKRPAPSTPGLGPMELTALAKLQESLSILESSRTSPYPMLASPKPEPVLRRLAPKSKRIAPFIFGLLFLGALAYGLKIFFGPADVTPLPYTHTMGLVMEKNKAYVADWFRKGFYVHAVRRGMPIISVENLPNSFITGIAVTDKEIWSVEGLRSQILRHSPTLDHQVVSSSVSPGKKPVGLFWDGSSLWSADQETKTLYRHHGNDLEDILDQYELPNLHVSDFKLVNGRIWILDGESRELRIYRLQKPMKEIGAFDLDPFLKGAVPTGVAVQKRHVWITTENPALLVRISRRELKKTKGDQF